MKFSRENVRDALNDMIPLMVNHWREIAPHKDILLEPDFKAYEALEDADTLRVYTARTDENILAGYAVFFVHGHLHHKQSKTAVQDLLYIDPWERGFGVGFMRWCDEELRAEGVQVVYHSVTGGMNFSPILEKIGYELSSLVYSRRLDNHG